MLSGIEELRKAVKDEMGDGDKPDTYQLKR